MAFAVVKQVAVASCVGGGPMERLVRRLADNGTRATVVSELDAQRWRTLMAAGRVGRVRARVRSSVVFPLRCAVRALFVSDDVIVTTTNPFFLPLVLVATRPLHRRMVVPLVYDLYPDALEAGGVVDGDDVFGKLATAANRFWFERADGLVFIGELMADHARARYGEPKRWTVIETGADSGEFGATSIAGGAQTDLERWCAGRTIISYVGNLGAVHDWETIAEGVPALLRSIGRERRIGIVIAASGPGVEALRGAWRDLDDPRVRFCDPLPDREWANLMVATDIALVTLRAAASRTSIPSKAFSAMAAGAALFVVAPADSDVANLIARHDCGTLVAPGDVGGFVAGLTAVIQDATMLRRHQTAGVDAVRDRYDMPCLAERWTEYLDSVSSGTDRASWYDVAKRILDLTVAGAALAVTAPLTLAAAGAIRATMGSPVLFRQQRPGRRGAPFELMKFRTMRHARPGEDGPDNDSARLTRLGKLLRATSIDELPTLLNVARGDMSLVGPRPLLIRYLERYSPRQARRHEVKPGVTGWAQVNGRNSISWQDKFELDVAYVERRSFWLDLKILMMTAMQVLARKDINAEGHATMPEFLGSDGDSESDRAA